MALFVVDNWLPVLPLVFLGMKTPPLPLALWIVGAVGAGVLTSISLRLPNYLAWRYSRRNSEPPDNEPLFSEYSRRESNQTQTRQHKTRERPASKETSKDDPVSDWEESSSKDWDFDKDQDSDRVSSGRQGVKQDSTSHTTIADPTSYDLSKELESSDQSDSVYSYSYRKPGNSGVGKSETVYDAKFRVINPPYKTVAKQPEEDEEDWGFEDDEDFE
ncbi:MULTISPECIES: hypothetical protein [Moorena]|uniref:hypothetical protein n=1 Tax=Moorena TaxID=1155738 RepID=UPI00030B64E0|nr:MULTISPECIES: hypothetical protein [Moorena]NEQ15191.1 LapA family protein [Moorena sp. SIO3E2]NEP34713.1 LapA family protein [Moorena sp. SIO3B2]NEP66161.1 LapA family protein [Moorena sp. SIO3A5]NER90725.1 LapA family protein [Moorena sp. SIO3A2]NES42111.1 LapA family protein [Moorena sp. SIO2C4]